MLPRLGADVNGSVDLESRPCPPGEDFEGGPSASSPSLSASQPDALALKSRRDARCDLQSRREGLPLVEMLYSTWPLRIFWPVILRLLNSQRESGSQRIKISAPGRFRGYSSACVDWNQRVMITRAFLGHLRAYFPNHGRDGSSDTALTRSPGRGETCGQAGRLSSRTSPSHGLSLLYSF